MKAMAQWERLAQFQLGWNGIAAAAGLDANYSSSFA
jgi:hypothetical protein